MHGQNIIGAELSNKSGKTFTGCNPRTGAATATTFYEVSTAEIEQAARLASEAAIDLQELPAEKIADFLEAIRAEIVALGDDLVTQADEETGLGLDRLRGERDRTANQLKLFADIAREGSWVDARIDTAMPDRKPLPRPDIRRYLQPIGPVAVFGASNFPLAFSVAGGDTASAFAARNPVVVKAHPAHPATSELVGTAIQKAVAKQGLPAGTFSLLHGASPETSVGLITRPEIKAVGFTGSTRAGRALFDAAAKRPEPIPVFAEMGSVNPVFLLPGALAERAETTAEALFKSVTLGVGQFCTSPGLAFGISGAAFERFTAHLDKQAQAAVPGTMLNANIAKSFAGSFERAAGLSGVAATVSHRTADTQKTEGRPGVMKTDAKTWLRHRELREEIFGPATIVVKCESEGEAAECAAALEGTLTATIHGTPEDLASYAKLVALLRQKAGRLIFNGYPTGVEVGYAMQHGGPYPSSTDARFTSVGAAAIYRFARPVCFQGFPDAALPAELKNANPRGIWRTLNGEFTRAAN